LLRPALSIWPRPLAAVQRLADLDRESGKLAGDRRAQVERVERRRAMSRLPEREALERASWASWLPWRRPVGRLAVADHFGAALGWRDIRRGCR
jgi:hypothetical protein